MKILFLAANLQSTSRLNLEEEVREIEEGLRRSKLSDRFQLVQRWTVMTFVIILPRLMKEGYGNY